MNDSESSIQVEDVEEELKEYVIEASYTTYEHYAVKAHSIDEAEDLARSWYGMMALGEAQHEDDGVVITFTYMESTDSDPSWRWLED